MAFALSTVVPGFSQTGTPDTSRDANNPPTAGQQKNNPSDRKTTADIRKSVVGDKSLSTLAHNVTIITQNGAVTLRGRVKSEDERRAIVAKAEEVAGKGKVTDRLMISTDSKM
jgi:osmotically-inducible protein OsmY